MEHCLIDISFILAQAVLVIEPYAVTLKPITPKPNSLLHPQSASCLPHTCQRWRRAYGKWHRAHAADDGTTTVGLRLGHSLSKFDAGAVEGEEEPGREGRRKDGPILVRQKESGTWARILHGMV